MPTLPASIRPASAAAAKTFAAALLLILCVCAAACSRQGAPQYVEYRSPAGARWDALDELLFSPRLPGQEQQYSPRPCRLMLNVRHSARVSASTLRLAMTASSGGYEFRRDTVAIPLTDADGRMLGKASYGVYSLSATLIPDLRVPRNLEITLRPADTGGIDGIDAIGLALVEPDSI